jgi:dTDP-4-dehydrorhamnose 3,5-epimerase
MNVTETELPGVLIIEPNVHGDSRGFFLETYQQERYVEAGIKEVFVQDNQSYSEHGVLRGLHLQLSRPQGKLVWVTSGRVFDVAADIDPASPTFGQYVSVELDSKSHTQMYVPPGYAHGFQVLTKGASFHYKCTDYYDPSSEGGVRWDDPTLNIQWPIRNPELSEKDLKLPTLQEIKEST